MCAQIFRRKRYTEDNGTARHRDLEVDGTVTQGAPEEHGRKPQRRAALLIGDSGRAGMVSKPGIMDQASWTALESVCLPSPRTFVHHLPMFKLKDAAAVPELIARLDIKVFLLPMGT